MMYVVLGMHKSGTSLVSQILHRSGIHMGDGFEEGGSYDDGNQWERRDAFLINLSLCGAREEDYFSLDHYRILNGDLPEATESAMRRMIDRREGTGTDWGFKEPLTCLTYALWKRALPSHKIVAVYRSPVEVINHYGGSPRRPGRAWKALRAWSNYNRGMMGAVSESGTRSILIRYEDLMRGEHEFSRLQNFLGRKLIDVRNPSQYRAAPKSSLYLPLDRLMSNSSSGRPSKILAQLEALRSQDAGFPGGTPVQEPNR